MIGTLLGAGMRILGNNEVQDGVIALLGFTEAIGEIGKDVIITAKSMLYCLGFSRVRSGLDTLRRMLGLVFFLLGYIIAIILCVCVLYEYRYKHAIV